jgi:hypothetical protein
MIGHRFVALAFLASAALTVAMLISPPPAYSHKPITTNIIFKNEIAQIFQRKCFQCHTDRNLGMSLTTYTVARPWARAIREEILERRMPPWTAVRGYGHFTNDISLSAREMEIILSWADGGAPSGVLKAEESIPPVFVPSSPEWDLGKPDAVLSIGEGQVIEPNAPFTVARVVVPTNLATPKLVRAIALKQGDRRVVRHAAFYDEASGKWLGAWTPWQRSSSLSQGLAIRLPAKARLAVEIGYSGVDERATDKSEIGLYFQAATDDVVDAITFTAPTTPLPAKTSGLRVRTEMTTTSDLAVIALWPNPGTGARSIEITATTPDGPSVPLLWIKDYRADWRSPYFPAEPVVLPRASRLAMTTYFDNAGDAAQVALAKTSLLVSAKNARK